MSEGTILVIEDDADIRNLLHFNLEKEGFTSIEAGDGVTGLAMAREQKPSLVLLDLMLPGMDGLRSAADSAVHRTPLRYRCSCSRPAARKWIALSVCPLALMTMWSSLQRAGAHAPRPRRTPPPEASRKRPGGTARAYASIPRPTG